MKAKDIRNKFVDFFQKNNHQHISSSSLIPHNDPTLLFANAGMNQFKDYFTGNETPSQKRAVSVQKCVRAGGKHNDLENVGFTPRHHTYFEMLGNFSFGDYFKEEAIAFAWKFLTEELSIPKNKLLITVHQSDDEAENIWMKNHQIPKERIFRLGDKENFWEMGDVGPCGPCTEIFYDHGEKYSDGKKHDLIIHDEGRYVEIWNLVFMQYEKKKNGELVKLPKPSVDTGAGLERVSAVMQGVYWNYDTDLFAPIISKIEAMSGKKYTDTKYQGSMRVIADHIRAATMLITDGAIASNEGRGYVLRRIIRRAIRHLNELQIQQTSFYKLVPAVFEVLGETYPENQKNINLAENILKDEEIKFRETLNQGMKILNDYIEQNTSAKFPGQLAFKLYDTYGFPVDLTEVILQEKNIALDMDGFNQAMENQKQSSRKSQKFQPQDSDIKKFFEIKDKFGASEFVGYDQYETNSKLIAKEVFGDFTALIFDKTPFYAESGGQTGDIGYILDEKNQFEILDTIKPVDQLHVHLVKEPAQNFHLGQSYKLRIDHQKRAATAKNHSATHLLQAALIKVLGNHVKQAGSLVTDEKLRFDFTHNKAMQLSDIDEVEKLVNSYITQNQKVSSSIMSKDKAMEKGAMALFGEKYGSDVRVIEMNNCSIELCGGTHVSSTAEIGIFKIILETSLATGVRRIEAITSENAFQYLFKRSSMFQQIERTVSLKNEDAIQKIEQILADLKLKNKEIENLQTIIQKKENENIFNNHVAINNFKLFITQAKCEAKDLRSLSDLFVDKYPNDVAFIYIQEQDKFVFILKTHKKNALFDLGKICQLSMTNITGRAGGKIDTAQGQGSLQQLDLFISQLKTNLSHVGK